MLQTELLMNTIDSRCISSLVLYFVILVTSACGDESATPSDASNSVIDGSPSDMCDGGTCTPVGVCDDRTEPTGPHVCEATGAGQCYYIATTGDDSNIGDIDNPWRSFTNLDSHYGSCPPPQPTTLAPGDVVYLRDGVHDVVNREDTDNGCGTGAAHVGRLSQFNQVHGTATDKITLSGYSGEKAIIDPGFAGVGLFIGGAEYFTIKDLEIRNAFSRGLKVEDSEYIHIDRMHIHDTDGLDNNNVSGMELHSSFDVEVTNSVFNDNYDRTNADTGGVKTHNSANVVLFGGGNQLFQCNDFYQTPLPSADKTGACLKYKHGGTTAGTYFRVFNNSFDQCAFFAIQANTHNTRISDNFISNGSGVVYDEEGPNNFVNIVTEYNTFYDSSFAISRFDEDDTSLPSFPVEPADLGFNNNILVSLVNSYGGEGGIVRIGTYYSDETVNLIQPALSLDNNCYFNPNTAPVFDFASAQNAGSLGDQYSFSEWQSQGFDQNSVVADPMFRGAATRDFTLLSESPCSAMGVRAQ